MDGLVGACSHRCVRVRGCSRRKRKPATALKTSLFDVQAPPRADGVKMGCSELGQSTLRVSGPALWGPPLGADGQPSPGCRLVRDFYVKTGLSLFSIYPFLPLLQPPGPLPPAGKKGQNLWAWHPFWSWIPREPTHTVRCPVLGSCSLWGKRLFPTNPPPHRANAPVCRCRPGGGCPWESHLLPQLSASLLWQISDMPAVGAGRGGCGGVSHHCQKLSGCARPLIPQCGWAQAWAPAGSRPEQLPTVGRATPGEAAKQASEFQRCPSPAV